MTWVDWSLSIVLEERGAYVVPDYTQATSYFSQGRGRRGGRAGVGIGKEGSIITSHLFPHSTLLSPINDFSLTQICDYLTLVSGVLRLNFSESGKRAGNPTSVCWEPIAQLELMVSEGNFS